MCVSVYVHASCVTSRTGGGGLGLAAAVDPLVEIKDQVGAVRDLQAALVVHTGLRERVELLVVRTSKLVGRSAARKRDGWKP